MNPNASRPYEANESVKFDGRYRVSYDPLYNPAYKIYLFDKFDPITVRHSFAGRVVNVSNLHCKELGYRFKKYYCEPEPDYMFENCDDIFSDVISAPIAVLVSIAVIAVNLSFTRRLYKILSIVNLHPSIRRDKFLHFNLAIAGLIMGTYTSSLAIANYFTRGYYFDYAVFWQHRYACKILGFMSVLANQLSYWVSVIMALDRYKTIINSTRVHLNFRFRTISIMVAAGWIYSLIVALLPVLFNVNSYSKSSICIPIRNDSIEDIIYMATLVIMDMIAATIFALTYVIWFLRLLTSSCSPSGARRRNDLIVVNLSLLIISNVISVIPLISMIRLLISNKNDNKLVELVRWTKFLMVTLYPFNSIMSPFLYGLSARRLIEYLKSIHRMVCHRNPNQNEEIEIQ